MGNNFNWDDCYTLNESIGDDRFESAIREIELGLKKVPKLTKEEFDVLRFCHDRDMRQFLKEEFEKHPIILNEDGELVGENPFEKERREIRERLGGRPPMTYEEYARNAAY